MAKSAWSNNKWLLTLDYTLKYNIGYHYSFIPYSRVINRIAAPTAPKSQCKELAKSIPFLYGRYLSLLTWV